MVMRANVRFELSSSSTTKSGKAVRAMSSKTLRKRPDDASLGGSFVRTMRRVLLAAALTARPSDT